MLKNNTSKNITITVFLSIVFLLLGFYLGAYNAQLSNHSLNYKNLLEIIEIKRNIKNGNDQYKHIESRISNIKITLKN